MGNIKKPKGYMDYWKGEIPFVWPNNKSVTAFIVLDNHGISAHNEYKPWGCTITVSVDDVSFWGTLERSICKGPFPTDVRHCIDFSGPHPVIRSHDLPPQVDRMQHFALEFKEKILKPACEKVFNAQLSPRNASWGPGHLIRSQAAFLYEFIVFLASVERSKWPPGLNEPEIQEEHASDSLDTRAARAGLVHDLMMSVDNFKQIIAPHKKLRHALKPFPIYGKPRDSWYKVWIAPGQKHLQKFGRTAIYSNLLHGMVEASDKGIQDLKKMDSKRRIIAMLNLSLQNAGTVRNKLQKRYSPLKIYCDFLDHISSIYPFIDQLDEFEESMRQHMEYMRKQQATM